MIRSLITPGSARRVASASLVAVLAVGLLAGTAFAGKGGSKPSGGGSTVALRLLDGTDGVANRGERAAFVVSTTATDRPFVGVRCYQAGAFIYDGYTGYFPTYMYDPWVTLDSPYWDPAAPADCTARLFYYNRRGGQVVLATTSFTTHP